MLLIYFLVNSDIVARNENGGDSAGGESSREEGKMEAAAAVAALPRLCVCNGGYVE